MIPILVVLIVLEGLLLWGAWDRIEKLTEDRNSLRTQVARVEEQRASMTRESREYERLMRETEAARERDAEMYQDRAMQYEKIIGDLHQQNRDFAETVAALRKEGMEGEKEVFVPDAEPVKPYSPDLRQFVSGIEGTEARQMVDEFITVRREHGLDDEQILDQLEQEGTV